MKKTFINLFLLIVILALAACSSATTETEVASPSTSTGTTTNEETTERQFTISPEMALALGTVKLDETDYAIDAEQAAALLPLWKALRSFGESETTAQAELEAVITQIEDNLTPEQLSAIETMELTVQDMAGVAEILGIELSGFGTGGGFGEMTPEMQETMQAMRESGEFQRPGGDLPGSGPGGGQGSGGGFGGAQIDPAARETAIAERGGARGARTGINTFLLNGIIEFLEAKTR